MTWTGYKVHLTETCDENEVHLITHAITTQAQVSDVAQTESIHKALATKALLPSEHIVDAGYVDSNLIVTSHKQYNIELVGPVRPNVSWQAKIPGGYDISQFKVNWNTKRVTCPQGKKSTKKWAPTQDEWGNAVINVRFPRKTCRLCPSRALCTRSLTEPRELRLRPKAEYQALQTRRQQQQTTDWKKLYDARAGVEGTLSLLIQVMGLRQARYVGLVKVRLQHLLTAVALNLVRMGAWLQGTLHAQTRRSRFAALVVGQAGIEG